MFSYMLESQKSDELKVTDNLAQKAIKPHLFRY